MQIVILDIQSEFLENMSSNKNLLYCHMHMYLGIYEYQYFT